MSSAFTWYANYHFTVNNERGISKNTIFDQKFGLKFSTIIFFKNDNLLVYDINPFHLICKIKFNRQ